MLSIIITLKNNLEYWSTNFFEVCILEKVEFYFVVIYKKLFWFWGCEQERDYLMCGVYQE